MRTNPRTYLLTAALALAVILTPALTRAQPGPAGDTPGPGPAWGHGQGFARMGAPGHRLFDKLNLSEDQQTKLAALRLEYRQAQTRLRGQLAEAKAELQALLMDPEAKRDAVMRAGDKVASLKAKRAKGRLTHRMDLRALLTPEQRENLVQMMAARPHWGDRGSARRGSWMRERAPRMRQHQSRNDAGR